MPNICICKRITNEVTVRADSQFPRANYHTLICPTAGQPTQERFLHGIAERQMPQQLHYNTVILFLTSSTRPYVVAAVCARMCHIAQLQEYYNNNNTKIPNYCIQ